MHLLEIFANMFANNQIDMLKNGKVLKSDLINFSLEKFTR